MPIKGPQVNAEQLWQNLEYFLAHILPLAEETGVILAMRACRDIGFGGVIRPDHVPVLAGESGESGDTMMGQLFAVGYMRGLIEAVGKEVARSGKN